MGIYLILISRSPGTISSRLLIEVRTVGVLPLLLLGARMLSSLEHQGYIQRGTVKILLNWWLIYPIVEPESYSQVLNIGFGSWVLVQHLLGQRATTEFPLFCSFNELIKHVVLGSVVKFVCKYLLG